MGSNEEKVGAALTAAEKLAQFEKEKLTRRQALARLGFQAGAAAVAALTADDLLRAVGKEMQRRAGDSKVAKQVAKEFNNAGLAFADVAPNSFCSCNQADQSSTSWWKCDWCEDGSWSNWSKRPALNCYVGSGVSEIDCKKCCDNRYEQCMAAYHNSVICGGKRDDCYARTCVGAAP